MLLGHVCVMRITYSQELADRHKFCVGIALFAVLHHQLV